MLGEGDCVVGEYDLVEICVDGVCVFGVLFCEDEVEVVIGYFD